MRFMENEKEIIEKLDRILAILGEGRGRSTADLRRQAEAEKDAKIAKREADAEKWAGIAGQNQKQINKLADEIERLKAALNEIAMTELICPAMGEKCEYMSDIAAEALRTKEDSDG